MYKIAKENLASLFALINETKELYLPVEVAGQTNFAAYTAEANVDLDTLKTVKSPKDMFFPQSEDIVGFKMEGKKIEVIDTRTECEDFISRCVERNNCYVAATLCKLSNRSLSFSEVNNCNLLALEILNSTKVVDYRKHICH